MKFMAIISPVNFMKHGLFHKGEMVSGFCRGQVVSRAGGNYRVGSLQGKAAASRSGRPGRAGPEPWPAGKMAQKRQGPPKGPRRGELFGGCRQLTILPTPAQKAQAKEAAPQEQGGGGQGKVDDVLRVGKGCISKIPAAIPLSCPASQESVG